MLSFLRRGDLRTCETAVLGSAPDHTDSVLNGEERQANGCMMTCV